LAPVCCVGPEFAKLAAAATVMAPLVPLTVLLAPAMDGLQPPELWACATTGVAKATTKIAIVRRDIHLFMRSVLYGWSVESSAMSTRSRSNHLGQSVSQIAEPPSY